MASVAFLGLGVMGYPMAGHLRNKGGHDVTVYNRTRARAEQWVGQHGGSAAATPAEAASGKDFVFSCVGNDEDLRSVTIGPKGAFGSMKKGAVYIDNTTASAEVARELAEKAQARAFRSSTHRYPAVRPGAENGVLTVMVGGEQKAFDEAKPVIDSYARMVGLMGPAGAGQLTKMINQICIAGLVQGLVGRYPFRQEGRTRHRKSHRGDFQGRGRLVADGKPAQDDECKQV